MGEGFGFLYFVGEGFGFLYFVGEGFGSSLCMDLAWTGVSFGPFG